MEGVKTDRPAASGPPPDPAALLRELGEPAILLDEGGLVVAASPTAGELIRMDVGVGRRLWGHGGMPPAGLFDAIDRVMRGTPVVRVTGLVDIVVLSISHAHPYVALLIREDTATRRDQFLAMLAHELRNPLGAALNALYVIHQRSREDSDLARPVALAERQLRRQARLLEDLLDSSRLVLGKLQLRRERVDLCDVVRRVMTASSLSIRTKAHDCRVQLPREPVLVLGDAERLEQVVHNLLGNAVKYTPVGGRISIALETQDGRARLCVLDTGIGIPASKLSWIFELFTQEDTSVARSQGGLGVGLALVRMLVEQHGGCVSARSDGRDNGSEFVVELPLTAPGVAPEPGPAPPEIHPLGGARHILLVEDNTDAREMLRIVLELEGYRVSEAPDGDTAVRLALKNAPDVVLLDLGLPLIDGYEAARRIRRSLGQAVRLVALTGYGDPEARRRTREAGFDLHLVKPVTSNDLVRAVTPF